MALNFPDNPSVNQIYTDTASGFSYVWDGTVWISFESSDLSTVLELDDISSNFNDWKFTSLDESFNCAL